MENDAIEIMLVCGKGKGNKDYYGLKIRHNYDSGNHFTKMVFLKKNEYDFLKSNFNIVVGD